MPTKPGGHLTQGDRIIIEEDLRASEDFASIAAKLNVSKMTITKEVRRNRVQESPAFTAHHKRNTCMRIGHCHVYDLCGRGCVTSCRECKQVICNDICSEYLPNICPWTTKAPYVCNDCRRRFGYGC